MMSFCNLFIERPSYRNNYTVSQKSNTPNSWR